MTATNRLLNISSGNDCLLNSLDIFDLKLMKMELSMEVIQD